MMERKYDISLAGGDSLVYLAKLTHKKYSKHLFGSIHLVLKYLMTNFSTPFRCTQLYSFWMTSHPSPSIPQLRTYLMDEQFLNQKTNKSIRISYSLKYKHCVGINNSVG